MPHLFTLCQAHQIELGNVRVYISIHDYDMKTEVKENVLHGESIFLLMITDVKKNGFT